MRAELQEIKKGLRLRMHWPIPKQGKWLGQVVTGYLNYSPCQPASARLRREPGVAVALWIALDNSPQRIESVTCLRFSS